MIKPNTTLPFQENAPQRNHRLFPEGTPQRPLAQLSTFRPNDLSKFSQRPLPRSFTPGRHKNNPTSESSAAPFSWAAWQLEPVIKLCLLDLRVSCELSFASSIFLTVCVHVRVCVCMCWEFSKQGPQTIFQRLASNCNPDLYIRRS
jgi:hypothetical protein